MGDRITALEEEMKELRRKEISKTRERNTFAEERVEAERLLKVEVGEVSGNVDAKIATFRKSLEGAL